MNRFLSFGNSFESGNGSTSRSGQGIFTPWNQIDVDSPPKVISQMKPLVDIPWPRSHFRDLSSK
jgi:hypothetical protein